MDNYNFGIIGNCRSGALISEVGSIEWSCLPDFDSNAVFCSLLDEEKGGSFKIDSTSKMVTAQNYIEDTNILRTHFIGSDSEFEIIDFMPRYHTEQEGNYSPPDIIRLVRPIRGRPKVSIHYNPTVDFARGETTTLIVNEYIKSYSQKETYDSVYLYTNAKKEKVLSGESFHLNNDLFFLISYNEKIFDQTYKRNYLKYERTKVYWLNWAEQTCELPKYNKLIQRSSLVLKLLNFEKTGAVIAALTTSLPETIGEVRNWDYRFCWIRDASMTVRVLTRLNHFTEARSYLNYILDIVPRKYDKLQIMYGIRGEKKLSEQILEHLSGYKGSSPVRIGNAAYYQKQNDIYGILMDIVHRFFELSETSLDNSEEFWTVTRGIVKRVELQWQDEDKGIWEIRKGLQHFTFSKVLCWVAIDRAVKVANLLKKESYVTKWTILRDTIAEEIHTKAWNEKLGAYTQYYGANYLDAAVLQMEPYGFIEATDPRFISTVKRIYEELNVDGLMFRYKNEDDFGTPSSSFTICSFWMISCLYKIGEKEKAIELFEKITGYTNHLGLLSEDIDFETKRLLGNFPQGYSHLALIETAILLSGETIT